LRVAGYLPGAGTMGNIEITCVFAAPGCLVIDTDAVTAVPELSSYAAAAGLGSPVIAVWRYRQGR
jgi:hypothetical protein